MKIMNWRTNLGGAIAITGTSLIGAGVLPQLLPASTSHLSAGQLSALWDVAFIGFVLSCVGKGVSSLFAADAAVVKDQITAVATAVDKINKSGSDEDAVKLIKPLLPPAPPTPQPPSTP